MVEFEARSEILGNTTLGSIGHRLVKEPHPQPQASFIDQRHGHEGRKANLDKTFGLSISIRGSTDHIRLSRQDAGATAAQWLDDYSLVQKQH